MNAATSRTWRVVNESSRNALGEPVGYKLVPTMSTPTMLASPESSVGRRAGFARHNLWVTPYAADERRAAGEFPNQHAGGDGLPRWTADANFLSVIGETRVLPEALDITWERISKALKQTA